MWGTDYISEIQRQFITVYGFKENPKKPGLPLHVPDGKYQMIIENNLDNVEVVNGMINCCNFKTRPIKNRKNKKTK